MDLSLISALEAMSYLFVDSWDKSRFAYLHLWSGLLSCGLWRHNKTILLLPDWNTSELNSLLWCLANAASFNSESSTFAPTLALSTPRRLPIVMPRLWQQLQYHRCRRKVLLHLAFVLGSTANVILPRRSQQKALLDSCRSCGCSIPSTLR